MRTFKFALLCLFLLPLQVHAESEGKVKIITGFNQAAQCISPTHILKIDGREVSLQSMGFDLEPGKHSLSGRTIISTAFCPTVGGGTYRGNTPPLEAVFEAGKTYWVGLDHSSPYRAEWKYVIWKVKG